MNEQLKDLIHEAMLDFSIDGRFSVLYETLKYELDSIPQETILNMKETILFICPDLKHEIDFYPKMRVLYEFSKLI